MEEARTGLPPKGIIEFDFEADRLEALSSGIIRFIAIEALIHHRPGAKARVKLKINLAVRPGNPIGRIEPQLVETEDEDEERSKGFMVCEVEILNALTKKAWYLYGETNDPAKRPICITIIPGIINTYAFKKDPVKN